MYFIRVHVPPDNYFEKKIFPFFCFFIHYEMTTPDFEKRLSKPLPVMPLSTSRIVLDDSFRNYFSTLLLNWLTKPWFNVLYNISIDLLEKSFSSRSPEENKEIYLQTFSTNTPVESKFLVNVYHGTPVNKGTHIIQHASPLLTII